MPEELGALVYRVDPSTAFGFARANRSARLGGVSPEVSSDRVLAPTFTKLMDPSPGSGLGLSELGVEDQQGPLVAGDGLAVVGEGDSLCRTARRRAAVSSGEIATSWLAWT